MKHFMSSAGWIIIACLLFWAIIVIVMVNYAWGAPYLTCDCSPTIDKVTLFQLKFNKAVFIDTPAVMTCGTLADKVVCTGDQRTICHDLSSFGDFMVIGRAVGPGGTSNDSLPFSFTKVSVPSSPSLLRKVQ
jgi:hypothetical protein